MTKLPKRPKENGCLIVFGVFIFLTAISIIIGSLTNTPETPKTPKQKKQEQELQSNRWYNETSSASCERSFKEDLRNPKTYERIGNFITTSDNGNEKVVIWKFRAENGFGGMNVAAAECSIQKKNGGEYQVYQMKG